MSGEAAAEYELLNRVSALSKVRLCASSVRMVYSDDPFAWFVWMVSFVESGTLFERASRQRAKLFFKK